MPRCLQFSNDFTSTDGTTYVVHYGTELALETCSTVDGNNIVMSSAEYEILSNNVAQTFLSELFDPSFITIEQYQMLFMLGLTTPLFAFIVAWGYQTVIGFMTKQH
jgi:hypothetical protein